jgi:IS30 family transposase
MRGQELVIVERERIMIGVARRESCRVIAGCLGRNHSVVSREIALNGGRESYSAVAAQNRTDRTGPARGLGNWKRIRNCMMRWRRGWRWSGHRGRYPSG